MRTIIIQITHYHLTLKQEEKTSSHVEMRCEGFLKKVLFNHNTAVENRK